MPGINWFDFCSDWFIHCCLYLISFDWRHSIQLIKLKTRQHEWNQSSEINQVIKLTILPSSFNHKSKQIKLKSVLFDWFIDWWRQKAEFRRNETKLNWMSNEVQLQWNPKAKKRLTECRHCRLMKDRLLGWLNDWIHFMNWFKLNFRSIS